MTEFEYKLQPVTDVLGGLTLYPLREDVLRFFDEFSSGAPDELTTVGAVLTGPDGGPAFGVLVCYCGSEEDGEKALKPPRSFAKPLADLIQRRAYLDMQRQLDEIWPPGRLYYNKAHNIRRLNDGAIQTILRYSAILPTAMSNIAFQQMHGAAGRVATSETAFPHRYDHYDLLVHPAADNVLEKDKIITWARECWEALQPFVERAVYVNALEDALEDGELRVREGTARTTNAWRF